MRILLADEQTRVRLALQILLSQEPGVTVVGEAAEATDLLAQIRATRPDLVLLDWGLPELVSIGSLSALHTACPNLSVIVLTGRPETRQMALAAGADEFISKIDPPEKLLAAIHTMNAKNSGVDLLSAQSV